MREASDQPPQVRAFPSEKLGPFLRAMADPDARGVLTEAERRTIADIEVRLAEARQTGD